MPRGCAVLGIVLKVELELREEDDVNMPKEKLAVTLPLHFYDEYFLVDEINTKPSSYWENQNTKKWIKTSIFIHQQNSWKKETKHRKQYCHPLKSKTNKKPKPNNQRWKNNLGNPEMLELIFNDTAIIFITLHVYSKIVHNISCEKCLLKYEIQYTQWSQVANPEQLPFLSALQFLICLLQGMTSFLD